MYNVDVNLAECKEAGACVKEANSRAVRVPPVPLFTYRNVGRVPFLSPLQVTVGL